MTGEVEAGQERGGAGWFGRSPVRRAELAWAVAWSVALAALTSAPYAAATALVPEGTVYLGFVYNPDDVNVHLSWIRQAADGAVFLRNQFTSEPHVGRFFNLFFLGCGWAARALHWSPQWVWQLARVLGTVLLGVACYLGLAHFTPSRAMRRLGLVVVTLSAGLGWFLVANGYGGDPVDVEPGLVMPEAFTFHSLYLNPLFSVSIALLAVGLVLGEMAVRRRSWPAAAGAGLVGLLLANIHTYDAVPFVAVLTVWVIYLGANEPKLASERVLRYVLILALCLPSVAYQRWLIASEPLYAAKANTPTLTPAFGTMLWSYGLLVPLAVCGAIVGWRRGQAQARFWVLWLVTHTACIYLPAGLMPFQRKMAEGLHLPLAVLATYGLWLLARWAAVWLAWPATLPRARRHGLAWAVRADLSCRRNAWTRPLLLLGVLALLPSTVLFVQSTIDHLRGNNQGKWGVFMPPFALPEDDLEAVRWLAEYAPKDSVVLCLPYVGNYLPGLTGLTVYLGHWAETIDFGTKLARTGEFLKAPGAAADKLAFLRQAGITHVYYGTFERMAADGKRPDLPEMERVYPPGDTGEADPPVIIWHIGETPPEAEDPLLETGD